MKLQYNAEHIATRIGQPFNTWPGNCFAIATAIVEAGIIHGRAVYGNYYGPIVPASMFYGKPVVRHGWIALNSRVVVDPTRWVFEDKVPYIYAGPANDDYDEGAQRLRRLFRTPPPKFDENVKPELVHAIPEELQAIFATWLDQPACIRVSINQLFWLANSPLNALGEHAKATYEFLTERDLAVFVPTDNYFQVMGHRWVPPKPVPLPPRMSDREWAAQPANLREGCTVHVPGVGDL